MNDKTRQILTTVSIAIILFCSGVLTGAHNERKIWEGEAITHNFGQFSLAGGFEWAR